MTDDAYHYPPELSALLVEAIPKLCKSKKDLLLFFRSAGMSKCDLQSHERLLAQDPKAFNKYSATRELIAKLNERGETALRARRELLRRVTTFDDFGVCWPNDAAAARGLVAQIRDLVNVKDSFTRMKIEREAEVAKRSEQRDAEARLRREELERRERVKAAFFSVFGIENAQKRGKALEGALGDLFSAHGFEVRKPFTVSGLSDDRVIEQIDGLVELDGQIYLVEMKWWNCPIGKTEVSPHLVHVYNRGGQVRGLFISYTEYTYAAIEECRSALAGGAVIVLSRVEEIVATLNAGGDLRAWLRTKARAALADKQPYTQVANPTG